MVHPADLPELVGGAVCLDLANTVGPRRPGPTASVRDRVPDYAALLEWSVHAGALTEDAARHLADLAARDEDGARATHARALQLREAIHAVFASVAGGDPTPPPAPLAVIEDEYRAALGEARLVAGPGRLVWRWPERGPLHQVVWPIAASAFDLASTGAADRVRQCPGDDGACGWLFVDSTKNGTRRWCSMRTCGNRLKSRRQAARRRTR